MHAGGVTSATQLPVTETSPPAGTCWTEENLDPDLQYHIQHCTCSCNHMGYGNFSDYQVAHGVYTAHPHAHPHPHPHMARVLNGGMPHFNGAVHFPSSHRPQFRPMDTYSDSSSDGPKAMYELRPCLLIVLCIVLILVCIVLGVSYSGSSSQVPESLSRTDIVKRLLREVPLIDGHNDLPWNIRKFVHNHLVNFNLSSDLSSIEPWSKSSWSHTDLPRLRKGMVGAQFWSAYVPCSSQHMDAVQITMEQVDIIRRFTELYSDDLKLVTSVQEIRAVHRLGKIASMIGVEGGHSLGNSMAVLRMFYKLGVRYLTLTHACPTPWAGCCLGPTNTTSDPDDNQGLSQFGVLVVRECNRLGMLVDLSHTSVETMKHVLNISSAPVIFSHSSAYALCSSPRNVPDPVLKLVALNDGIVMVSFYSLYLTCSLNSSIDDVIAHLDHIKNVAGEDHVGLGAGYDGINYTAKGLEDVSHYPDLLAALLDHPSWTETQVKKLAGLNFLRVLGKAEQIRDEMKDTVKPIEDWLAQTTDLKPLNTDCITET
uniref:Dipeptidase n=1 Tax=Cacopsylla melanoneura TaxID=428564 RepID=A0A8D9EXR7_9HEMI